MKALVLKQINEPLTFQEVQDPQEKEGYALVHLKAAALNHRDAFIRKGLYPGIECPVIPGSDGAGTCAGKAYLINPNINWGKTEKVQSPQYHILGTPTQGTFAEKVLVKSDRIFPKPDHLSWEEAAALPLAGLTAWRALFSRGGLAPGERVLISGIGGGVALFSLQFALAAGATVSVTSGHESKIDKALALGAIDGRLYTEKGWGKKCFKAGQGFDLIIDSAGGNGFAELIEAANPGGRLVMYGGTRGIAQLNPQRLFWKQLTLMGSTMGSDEDFKRMIAFVAKHQIKPIIDSVFSLEKGNEALDRMDEGLQFGKIVLQTNAS